jgi:hypothetical protein
MIITFRTTAHPGSTENYALSVSDVIIHDSLNRGIEHLTHMVGSLISQHIEKGHAGGEYLWVYHKTEGEYENAYTHYYWLVDLNIFNNVHKIHELTKYAYDSILEAETIAKEQFRNKNLDILLK